MEPRLIQAYIDRWSRSGGAERANYALFLSERSLPAAAGDILDVARPEPKRPNDDDNAYVFERRVVFINPDGTSTFGRKDLYKRGCFVLETKQGVEEQDQHELLSEAARARQKKLTRTTASTKPAAAKLFRISRTTASNKREIAK
jgi:hypothetical protein